MSKLDNLRRLYSFPSPRVRVCAEALEGDEAADGEFYDINYGTDDYLDVNESDTSDGIHYTDLVFFQTRWTERFVKGYSSAAEMAGNPDSRALLAALMTVEFTDQQPEAEIDTEKPIFVAEMDDMAIVAFDSTQGYVQIFMQLDPLACCYGYIKSHDPDSVRMELDSTSSMIWQVSEDEYYDALISLATELTE